MDRSKDGAGLSSWDRGASGSDGVGVNSDIVRVSDIQGVRERGGPAPTGDNGMSFFFFFFGSNSVGRDGIRLLTLSKYGASQCAEGDLTVQIGFGVGERGRDKRMVGRSLGHARVQWRRECLTDTASQRVGETGAVRFGGAGVSREPGRAGPGSARGGHHPIPQGGPLLLKLLPCCPFWCGYGPGHESGSRTRVQPVF